MESSESLKYGGGYQSDQGRYGVTFPWLRLILNLFSDFCDEARLWRPEDDHLTSTWARFRSGKQVGFSLGLGGRLAEWNTFQARMLLRSPQTTGGKLCAWLPEGTSSRRIDLAESQRSWSRYGVPVLKFPFQSLKVPMCGSNRRNWLEWPGGWRGGDPSFCVSRQSSSLDKSPRMANYRSRMKHPRRWPRTQSRNVCWVFLTQNPFRFEFNLWSSQSIILFLGGYHFWFYRSWKESHRRDWCNGGEHSETHGIEIWWLNMIKAVSFAGICHLTVFVNHERVQFQHAFVLGFRR